MKDKNLNAEKNANSDLGAVIRWVAIDKPPKKDGKYLVYIEEVDLIMIGEWKEDCFHGDGTLPISTVVSHWQPLPKPPCLYPYSIRETIELVLKLDGYTEDTINEFFGWKAKS